MAMKNLIEKQEEKWIWVTGYKGTDKDMKCRDYQYELKKPYYIPENEEVAVCSNGFHLCKELSDVYGYYTIGHGNRFFEVSALVRENDLERYARDYRSKKLVARSIIFIRELEPDEILQAYFADRYRHLTDQVYEANLDKWTDEHKRMALEFNIDSAINQICTDSLVSFGYAVPFARYVVSNGAYYTAAMVASQKDLSMDMRAMFIFDTIQQRALRRGDVGYKEYRSRSGMRF